MKNRLPPNCDSSTIERSMRTACPFRLTGEALMATGFVDTAIGEYLRERLMPVEA